LFYRKNNKTEYPINYLAEIYCSITAKEFNEKFDKGEDISEYLDFSKAIRPNALKTDTKKVNVATHLQAS